MSEDTADVPPAKRAKLEEEHSSQETNFGEHVTQEEVDKLRQFQVLDEVKSDDEDSNDDGSDKSSSDELPEEEIEKMLEEGLPEEFKGAPKQKEKKYVKRQKIVLEEKGINHFEVLPLDWMMVRHASGMPVYMHRGSRVCTLSKPYFLGKGNTRRHDIPISAIPCLAYRIALKEEEKQKEIDRQIAEQIKNGTWADPPPEDSQTPDNAETDTQIAVNLKEEAISVKADSQSPEPLAHLEGSIPSPKLQIPDNNSQNSADISQNPEEESENPVEISYNPSKVKILEESSQSSADVSQSPDDDSQNPAAISQNSIKNSQSPEENSESPDEKPLNPDSNYQSPEENSESPADTSQKDTEVVGNTDMVGLKCENSQESLPEKLVCPFQRRLMNMKEDTNDSTEGSEISKPEEKYCEDILEFGEESQSSQRAVSRARPVVLPGGLVMPPPRVETVNTSWKSQQLSADQINDYCKKLFKFKEVYIMHFKRWADRRKYTKARKTMQYPTLPEGTKLITIPAQDNGDNGGGKAAKRDWVMNMNGGSYLSVFHEYVRRALRKQPVYEFKQLENASAPYEATVYIGGMRYGVGQGSSKRQAKSHAARASIRILIPDMCDEARAAPPGAEPDLSFFDYVTIEDPRIQEFCGAAAEPSPHAILRTCLLRNFGAGDRHIHTEMKKLEFQKIELTMKVGKHSATVVCKNKKLAKQRASQAILQQLHPHITSWGSLLRLYGSRSVKSCKEKKLEEQQITLLQDKARHNEPNHAVLEKLRQEMSKLRERDHAVLPIGRLLVAERLPTHSGSNLNNVDL